MEKVFDEVNSLDKRCYDEYGLSEDILMEHAANSMAQFISESFDSPASILIACGAGNNGADGIALGRLLHAKFHITLYVPFGSKSPMGELQTLRAKKIGLNIINNFPLQTNQYDIVVDALFGTGISRELDEKTITIIEELNKISAYKIACDIPSGINTNGDVEQSAFKAHTTVTMGALKKSLTTDTAKDYVGEVIVADLGVQRELYEGDTNCYLLEESDLKLPLRDKKTTHKGTFGHLGVIVGQKHGAGMLCAEAGFAFGAGLVSVIDHQSLNPPYHIMQSHKLPKNTTAIALGMGLGSYDKKEICEILDNDIPKIIDADLFYEKDILKALDKNNIVLTPHPKEFCALLKLTGLADIKVKKLQKDRFKYVTLFCTRFPNVVLLLKGSNVLISQADDIYINTFGSNKLSFGGSGDVLAGLIGSLLAQGYNPLQAAISGSLAHTLAAKNFNKNNYAMTPWDIIEEVKNI
jgi:hydroxyethylthiazole kinase-like uncharacterized protein yjeF